MNVWKSFSATAETFMQATEQFVKQDVSPGDYYKAVWCRDAAYILRDWFLSNCIEDVMRELLFIWSHQISPIGEKVIYGRGSPDMEYTPRVANPQLQQEFQGMLPTTVFRGFSEVYGRNPDIDSTALMISSTSRILDTYLKSGITTPSSLPVTGVQELRISSVAADPSTVIEYVVPKMLLAVERLAARDIDEDGLLEQERNEDWMDTILRADKIVYSQACWILALGNLSSLLTELGMKENAGQIHAMAVRAINAVEEKLWSESKGTYLDRTDGRYGPLTQDTCLYIVAVTETSTLDSIGRRRGQDKTDMMPPYFAKRANRTLDTFREKIWKDGWPLVTEAALERTGPWKLQPNQYHNHTLWPWKTGIEMLARSRFGRAQECDRLLNILVAQDSQSTMRAFYEWVNPITNMGSGAYPFRTGISMIRMAITDILTQARQPRIRNE
jgi:glycogen debranching enzyme